MTRSEFKGLYRQSLFEACEKWPDSFSSDWRKEPEDKIERWVSRVMEAIPTNGIIMTDRHSSFAVLCGKLGIRQTVRGIQEALAACSVSE